MQIARRIAVPLAALSLAFVATLPAGGQETTPPTTPQTPPPPRELQQPAPQTPSPPPQLTTPPKLTPPKELTTAPPAAAGGEQVVPDRLAAARELLQATNTDAQFATVIPMMFAQLKQSIPPSGAKMQEELDKVFGEIQQQFIDRRSEVLDQIAILYARKFSAEEMRGLAEFYRSPLAQKFIAAMPELTVDAMKLGNAWGRQIAMDAERKVREEMRRRGFDL